MDAAGNRPAAPIDLLDAELPYIFIICKKKKKKKNVVSAEYDKAE